MSRFMRPRGLDAMDSYAQVPDDPARLVPNPAKAKMRKALAAARAALAAAKATCTTEALEGKRPSARPIEEAGEALAALKAQSATVPAKVPLGDVRPGAMRLDDERERLHDAVRMVTWNAEHPTTPGQRTKPTASSLRRSPPQLTSRSQATSSMGNQRRSSKRRSLARRRLRQTGERERPRPGRWLGCSGSRSHHPGTGLSVGHYRRGHPKGPGARGATSLKCQRSGEAAQSRTHVALGRLTDGTHDELVGHDVPLHGYRAGQS
jgi:hypothetical protein